MRPSANSQILRAPLHRLVIDLIAVFLEQEVDAVGPRELGAQRQFAVKLAGRPARIAKG
jgi:hypothetical protein